MKIVSSVLEVKEFRKSLGGSLGFVPTMGYLHRGHRSLVERAKAENETVWASLFVNPLQFAPTEDLESYPRDFQRDRAFLDAAGCDLLFAPSALEMYPAGFSTSIDVGPLAARLEGERRPGHFRGVATIVMKLLQIFEPTRAYFGEKDAQQLQVIRVLVRDLNVPTTVVGCPIIREPDGVAMSSRNSYLQGEERKAATVLIRALRSAEGLHQDGERRAEVLRSAMRTVLERERLAQMDYASVANPETFEELDTVAGPAQLLLAVRIGKARLIDTLRLP